MGKKESSLEKSARSELRDFGILQELSTYEYVLWLETESGIAFLKTIRSPNRELVPYWTMHAAKSKIITEYAKFIKK